MNLFINHCFIKHLKTMLQPNYQNFKTRIQGYSDKDLATSKGRFNPPKLPEDMAVVMKKIFSLKMNCEISLVTVTFNAFLALKGKEFFTAGQPIILRRTRISASA